MSEHITRGQQATRHLDFQVRNEKIDERTFEVSIASDIPVERGYYTEVLEISERAIDKSRIENKRCYLFRDHKTSDSRGMLGKITSIRMDGGMLYGTIEVREGEEGDELLKDIEEGYANGISIGYTIDEYEIVEKSDTSIYNITRWTILETSVVGVPADPEVGFSREQEVIPPMSNKPQENTPSYDPEPVIALGREMDVTPDRIMDAVFRKLSVEESRTLWKEVSKIETASKEAVAEAEKRMKELEDEIAKLKEKRDQVVPPSVNITGDASRKPHLGANLYGVALQQASRGEKVDGFVAELSQELEGRIDDTNLRHNEKKGERAFRVHPTLLFAQTNAKARAALASTNAPVEDTYDPSQYIGALIPSWDLLGRLGVTRVDLTQETNIPRQTTAGAAHQVNADGTTDPTDAAPVFGTVDLNLVTAGYKLPTTRRVDVLSNPFIGTLAVEEGLAQTAILQARMAFEGSGSSNQPTGIENTTGVGSVTVTKGSGTPTPYEPTRAQLLSMATELTTDHVDDNDAVFVADTAILDFLAGVSADTGSGLFNVYINANGDMVTSTGKRIIGWSGFSGTGNTKRNNLFLGVFSQLLLGEFGAPEVRIDGTSNAGGGTTYRVYRDYAVAVRHASAFCRAA